MRITAAIRLFTYGCAVRLQLLSIWGRGNWSSPAGAALISFARGGPTGANHWPRIANHNERRVSHEERAERPPNRPPTLAVAVIVAMLMAFFTTFERVEKRTATSQTAPGTTGLATARPPLDRASGQPVLGKWGQSARLRIRLASPSIRRGPADNRRKSALLAWYVAADRRRSEPHMTTTPRSSRRTTAMPDHACARSYQKQEIDQAAPPSSPSDPLGYTPYCQRFKIREKRRRYPIRALRQFRLPSTGPKNVNSLKQDCPLYWWP